MSKASLCSVLIAALCVSQAHAFAPRQPQKVTQIQAPAVELVLRLEKPYNCTLNGPELGFFTTRLEVPPITATNLQDAAELAITSVAYKKPIKGDPGVRVLVDGKEYLINNVNCKPTDSGI